MYPTLAALANTGTPTDSLDGISLEAVFDDPTLTTIPSPDTLNKTVAFTQYPGQTFSGCNYGYVVNGQCSNPNSTATAEYMGFSVRTHDFRYTVWLPSLFNKNDPSIPAIVPDWNATNTSTPPRLVELYDHRGDDGTNFDWPGNDRNIALDPENDAVIASMHQIAYTFFQHVMPAAHPVPHGPTPPPPPAPPVPCTGSPGAGWRIYPKSFCAGRGEKTVPRYFYHGSEDLAACQAKCAGFGRATECKCLDYGNIPGYAGACHLQNETTNLKKSGDGLTAYIPC